MTGLAAIQIDRKGSPLGVSLINDDGENFFLHEQSLLALWSNPSRFVQIKRRNRDPQEAIGYHAGQVLGTIDRVGDEVELRLFFGPVDHDLKYDSDTKSLIGAVGQENYRLPHGDLEAVARAFAVFSRHRSHFHELKVFGKSQALYDK